MITVEEARTIIQRNVCATPAMELALRQAAAHGLCERVAAPYDHPLFHMSAVDGYAFAHEDTRYAWRIRTSLAAGDVFQGELAPGECARIFTGAMLPSGTDTVVMQEFATVRDGRMTHDDAHLKAGSNVRRQGEQLKAGAPVLHAGTWLGPAEVGLLASVGIQAVSVHRKPTVSIVRTGGEFTMAEPPEPGRIFSSNELMLAAALAEEGISTVGRIHTPRDERNALRDVFATCLNESELVITTGGVSVGEHDLVRSVLEGSGCTIQFHGVRQKPGKPMLLATRGNRVVFGLPGNPRAVLVAWHLYVRPFLRAMQGGTWPRSYTLPLAETVRWKNGRTEFRAGLLRDGRVHLLPDEGSHMLKGLTSAEFLVELPASGGELPRGAEVVVHQLPRV